MLATNITQAIALLGIHGAENLTNVPDKSQWFFKSDAMSIFEDIMTSETNESRVHYQAEAPVVSEQYDLRYQVHQIIMQSLDPTFPLVPETGSVRYWIAHAELLVYILAFGTSCICTYRYTYRRDNGNPRYLRSLSTMIGIGLMEISTDGLLKNLIQIFQSAFTRPDVMISYALFNQRTVIFASWLLFLEMQSFAEEYMRNAAKAERRDTTLGVIWMIVRTVVTGAAFYFIFLMMAFDGSMPRMLPLIIPGIILFLGIVRTFRIDWMMKNGTTLGGRRLAQVQANDPVLDNFAVVHEFGCLIHLLFFLITLAFFCNLLEYTSLASILICLLMYTGIRRKHIVESVQEQRGYRNLVQPGHWNAPTGDSWEGISRMEKDRETEEA